MSDVTIARATYVPAGRRDRRVSAVQHVYDALKRKIIQLDLEPGSVISKNDVAQEFGVSPTPVREALLKLDEEGLVSIYPQSRTVVSLINLQDAREAHFLRLSIEVEIARRLAKTITEAQLDVLRTLADKQGFELQAGRLDEFVQLDNRLHRTMYEFANVAGLWKIVRTKRAHLDRLRHLHLPTEGRADTILGEHWDIIDALASRDSDAAEKTVRRHLPGMVFKSDGLRAQYPQYFG